MRAGIYRIVCSTSGKIYVGSAVHMRKRENDHQHHLRANTHHSRKLQNAWNKYGAEAFVFETLLLCSPENLLVYEQLCINGFDAVKSGYNTCPIAGSILGTHRTEETKRKISLAHTGRKHTGQALANMQLAARQRVFTPEQRGALSLARKGIHKAKLAAAWVIRRAKKIQQEVSA